MFVTTVPIWTITCANLILGELFPRFARKNLSGNPPLSSLFDKFMVAKVLLSSLFDIYGIQRFLLTVDEYIVFTCLR